MTVEILTEYKHTWCPLSSMCTFRPRGGPQCIILYALLPEASRSNVILCVVISMEVL